MHSCAHRPHLPACICTQWLCKQCTGVPLLLVTCQIMRPFTPNSCTHARDHQRVGTSLPIPLLPRNRSTNVFGYVFITKAALPYMVPGGSIINPVSVEAYEV